MLGLAVWAGLGLGSVYLVTRFMFSGLTVYGLLWRVGRLTKSQIIQVV